MYIARKPAAKQSWLVPRTATCSQATTGRLSMTRSSRHPLLTIGQAWVGLQAR